MEIQSVANRQLAAKINAYLAKAAETGRTVEVVGPFVASVDVEDANSYRNYAIPVESAAPSDKDVAELVCWFRERKRKPRLEYVPQAAPEVEFALLRAGFEAQGSEILMTLGQRGVEETAAPSGIEFVQVVEDEDLRRAAATQNEAYEGGPVTDADVARLKRNVDRGGLVIASRDMQSGQTVGAGLYTPPQMGVTEIAAVGVITAFRKRGVATGITAALVRSALARNIELPFLMAAGVSEQRMYERIGFEVRGSVLQISLPEV